MSLPPRPEFGEQLTLPRQYWYKLKSSYDCTTYRVLKSSRQMPGQHERQKGRWENCGPDPRVKIKEPGVYRRQCSHCGRVYWFVLDQTQTYGLLRFRWVSEEEARERLDEEARDIEDRGLDGLGPSAERLKFQGDLGDQDALAGPEDGDEATPWDDC